MKTLTGHILFVDSGVPIYFVVHSLFDTCLFFRHFSLLLDMVDECLILDQRSAVMRRVQRRERPALDFCISSSDEDDPGDTATAISRISDHFSISPNDSAMVRLSLLPAFPSLYRHGTQFDHGRNHLLLANVPRTYPRFYFSHDISRSLFT